MREEIWGAGWQTIEGARELCGVATAGQLGFLQPLAETRCSGWTGTDDRSSTVRLFLFCVPARTNRKHCLVSLSPSRARYNHPIDPHFGLSVGGEDLIKMSMGGHLLNRIMGLVIGCDTCLRH